MSSTAVPFRLLVLGWTIVLVGGTGAATAAGSAREQVSPPRAPVAMTAAPAVVAPVPPPLRPAPEPPPPPPPPPPPAPPQPAPPRQSPAAAPPPPARPEAPEPPTPPSPAPPSPASSPTGWPALDAAIARTPGYDGSATWHVSTGRPWGTADWYEGSVTISRSTPAERLDDVVRHEWSHLLSVRPYASVSEAVTAMNAWFGGEGLVGPERAADCMALELGVRWTHYTDCRDPAWRDGARRLLAGQRLA